MRVTRRATRTRGLTRVRATRSPSPVNSVDCGVNGTPSNEVFTPATKSGSFDCTWSDDSGAGTAAVKATVGDDDGGTDTDTVNVDVNNVAPTVTLLGPATGNEGDTKSYTYSWTDPGTADTFPALGNSVECGLNGTPSAVVFTPAGKSGSFDCTWSDDSAAGTAAVK